jgi:hypothetical protein
LSHSWSWWFIPVIPALGKLKQEDGEFKVMLGVWLKWYTSCLACTRPCLESPVLKERKLKASLGYTVKLFQTTKESHIDDVGQIFTGRS